MTTAIEVHGVGKQYFRATRPAPNRITEVITQWGRGLVDGRERDHTQRGPEPFWALRDVSFTIAQGDVVGLIGGNGSGKSTLLKVISQITAPTTGEVRL